MPQRGGARRALHRFIQQAPVAHALQPQAVHHVFMNRFRERVRPLEHHAHPPPQRHVDLRTGDRRAVQLQLALDAAVVHQIVHAVETAQQRRFTAARGADQGRHPVFRDTQRNIVQHLFVAIKQVEAVDRQRGLFIVEMLDIQPGQTAGVIKPITHSQK